MTAQVTTKTCTKCKHEKPLDAFYWHRKGGRRHGHCKGCHKDITHGYYRKNRQKYIDGSMAKKRANRAQAKELLAVLKAEPCTDCGNRFPPCVMQFDHVRGRKRGNVATLVGEGHSLSIIKLEIAKCELVCSNCHAIRTDSRRLGARAAVNG